MGERDAFGREKGEDPLAGLGWTSTTEPEPAAPAQQARVPDPVAATPEFQVPTSPPLPRLRRRRRRGFVTLILFGAIVVIAAASAASLIRIGSDAVDDLEGAIRDAVPTTAPPAPVGVDGGSLVRPAELRAALAKLPAGQIEMLRVAPERIDAQVIVDGRMQVVQVRSDGEVTTVSTPATGRGEPVKVNAVAPSRIVRTAARRAGRDPSTVSYLVLTQFGDTAEWQLFFADGLHFSASANGKKVRRIG